MDSGLASQRSVTQLSTSPQPNESLTQQQSIKSLPFKTLTIMNSEVHNISHFSDKPVVKSSSSFGFIVEPRNNLKRRVLCSPLNLSPLKASGSIEVLDD